MDAMRRINQLGERSARAASRFTSSALRIVLAFHGKEAQPELMSQATLRDPRARLERPQEIDSSSRLQLLAMPLNFLEACRQGDRARAEKLIGLSVPLDWLQECVLISERLADFRDHPAYAPWGLRAVALRASRTMIGHVGFHSLPNAEYLQPYWPHAIELAYTVYPRHRRRGYALEAVGALMRWASGRASIRRFLACIAADNRASQGLAEKLGFVMTRDYIDTESCQRNLVYILNVELPSGPNGEPMRPCRGHRLGWVRKPALDPTTGSAGASNRPGPPK